MGLDLRSAALAAALGLACPGAPGAREDRSAENPGPSLAEKDEVREREVADLERVDAAIKAHPDSFALRFERLRILHVLAVGDEDRIRTGEEELRRLSRWSGHPPGDPLFQAYRGAFQVIRAKHAPWPPRKREHLKAGLPALDSAVAARPGDIRIRYLRLVSCYHLPFFIGRKASVREDFSALARLLPEGRGGHSGYSESGRWYLGLARFVLEKGEPGPADREALSALVRERAAAAGPRGGDGEDP